MGLNQLEMYVVELLQGNITYNDEIVPVRKQFSDTLVRPCITLDLSVNPTVQRVRREFREREDAFQYYRDAQLNINLWCDTEDEREHISQQIMNRFYEEQTEHIRVGEDSLTTKHGLIHGTVNIEESFQMDELAEHPPLLRSVFRVEGIYISEYVVKEDSFEGIEYEIEVIDETEFGG